MPSWVMPRTTVTPLWGTWAKLVVQLGAARIAWERSLPTLSRLMSMATVNSMSQMR